MKKIALMLVCLLMTLACIAIAEEKPTTYISGAYEYILLEDGTAEIADYLGDSSNLEIPEKLDGFVVTSIGDSAFSNCDSLTEIIIPDSVTSIGDDAFLWCSSLTEITIPDSVISIGDFAFERCYSLTEITIPDSVTSIGEGAFSECRSLRVIIIPDSVTSIGNYAFSQCHSLTEIIIPDSVTSIGVNAFFNCESLTEIIIPDNVTFIGANAFSYCESLTEIIIPDSVTSIGVNAFFNCESLTEIIIPGSVTSIYPYTFSNCESLTEIIIPDSVTFIGQGAFEKCDSLTLMVNKNSYAEKYAKENGIKYTYIESINSYAEKCAKEKNIAYTYPDTNPFEYILLKNGTAEITGYTGKSQKVDIPKELDSYVVTSIGAEAFYGHSSITTITIPDGVTSIGYKAFCDCDSLTEIYIPNSVTAIRYWSFDKRDTLTLKVEKDSYAEDYAKDLGFAYTYPELVRYEYRVLNDGTAEIIEYIGLSQEVVIPNELDGYLITSIGDYAFSSCEFLTKISIPESVTSIGKGAFQYCESLTKVIIPEGVTSIAQEAFKHCKSLTEISIPDSVTSIGELAFSTCKSLTKISIPDSVISIGISAFRDCESLKEVNIPDNVTSIRNSTFSDCKSLTKVIIPDSVTSIGAYAFNFCQALKEIVIPDGVTTIGKGAFYACDDLEKIIIPNSVTSIGEEAFYACKSLTKIIIPDSVTSIGDRAFHGCKSLTLVVDRDSYAEKYAKENKIKYIYPDRVPFEYKLLDDGTAEITDYLGTSSKVDIPEKLDGHVVTTIGVDAFFEHNTLTEIIIPDSVTSIGKSAFYSCKSLTEIIIPDSVTSIGREAFSHCSSLTEITIPDSVTSIGREAFSHCSSLTEITIPDSVTSIELLTFFMCESLTKIVIPNSVTTIRAWSFRECKSLTEIIIPDSVTFIGSDVFTNCESLTLMVERGSYAEQYAKENNIEYKYIAKSDEVISKANAEEYEKENNIEYTYSDAGNYENSYSDNVVMSLLGNSECPHTSLTVGEKKAEESYKYTSIDENRHLVSFPIIERWLCCQLCGNYSQAITVNEQSSYERSHSWKWKSSVTGNKQEYICSKCGFTKQVKNPCSHNDYSLREEFDGYVLYCNKCNKSLNPNTRTGCKHDNVTVLYNGTVRTWYEKWDHEMHLKVKAPWQYSSLEISDTYLSAYCNDCGRVLEHNTKTGNSYDVSMPSGGMYIDTYKSEFEKHNFIDGVCIDCKYIQTSEYVQPKETKIEIFTSPSNDTFIYGEDIKLWWEVDAEGANLYGKIDLFYENIHNGYFDGIKVTDERLSSGSWDIRESVLTNDGEGLYYARLKVFDGDVFVGEDIVSFTIGYDAYMSFLDNLDRDDLELWLDNQNPRDNEDEYIKGGFLLLEETLNENWGGWIHEAAYQAYKFGMDILSLLGFNPVGLVNDIYELTDDSTEIEALLIENYALYLASLSEDMEISIEEEKASRTLYEVYSVLHDNWGGVWDIVDTGVDLSVLNGIMSEKKMSLIEFLSLHSEVKRVLSANINELIDTKIAYDKIIGEGVFENFVETCKKFEDRKNEFGTFSNKMGRVKTVADVFGYTMDVVSLGQNIYSALKEKDIAIDKYSAYIQMIAQNTEDFNAILDAYISASDNAKYRNALEQFKTDLNDVVANELVKRLTDNEVADSRADVCETAWNVLLDTVKIICEKKNIRPAWFNKWPTSSTGANWAVIITQITGSVSGSIVKIEEKEAVLKQMLYYEDLKESLGKAILNEYDNYRKAEHTPEKATEIVTSLRYMKQLKYSGEYKALELLAIITEVIKYDQNVGVAWYLMVGENSNSSWLVSNSRVNLNSASVQLLVEQLEASGYTVMCTRQAVTSDSIASFKFNNSSGSIELVYPTDMVTGSYSRLPNPFNFRLPKYINSSEAVSVMEAITLTQVELEEELKEIELRMDEDANDPNNYIWWVKYVEDYTSARIEALKLP